MRCFRSVDSLNLIMQTQAIKMFVCFLCGSSIAMDQADSIRIQSILLLAVFTQFIFIVLTHEKALWLINSNRIRKKKMNYWSTINWFDGRNKKFVHCAIKHYCIFNWSNCVINFKFILFFSFFKSKKTKLLCYKLTFIYWTDRAPHSIRMVLNKLVVSVALNFIFIFDVWPFTRRRSRLYSERASKQASARSHTDCSLCVCSCRHKWKSEMDSNSSKR